MACSITSKCLGAKNNLWNLWSKAWCSTKPWHPYKMAEHPSQMTEHAQLMHLHMPKISQWIDGCCYIPCFYCQHINEIRRCLLHFLLSFDVLYFKHGMEHFVIPGIRRLEVALFQTGPCSIGGGVQMLNFHHYSCLFNHVHTLLGLYWCAWTIQLLYLH